MHALEGVDRHHKIRPRTEAIERLWVELFLEAHRQAPKQIVLDLDATDDPLHGHQEGRFFHGYYDHYCYLPLYIFCGEHLLVSSCAAPTLTGLLGQARRSNVLSHRSVSAGRRYASFYGLTRVFAARS